jgi:VIT1/CCC1 family predicted Fe2+/Mn2+ transporter
MTEPPHQPLTDLEATHTPHAIRQRLQDGPADSYLRDFILGAVDGTVTTFAVVAGVSGAALAPGIAIILGVANLAADGFSMGISNFLGSQAENQQRDRIRREEERQIRVIPEGEREEIRQIFASKGFTGADLDRAVEVITSDADRWLNTMLREEHGFPAADVTPWRAGLVTFIGFLVAALVPLLSYIYLALFPTEGVDPFTWSIILSAATFFAIGALKTRFVDQSWYRGGLETLAVGGAAAVLAYLMGALLRGLADAV